MKDLWNIYHNEIPEIIKDFMNTKAMQRLKHVGMNCGVEYTSFPLFVDIPAYSRFDHSVGVALIIYHFTHDHAQCIAGLLHDIATPVFAHTIDFLNGDHLTQESTENLTETMIKESKEIQDLLKMYHIHIDQVINYHDYPIADNETPRLSADRLEYTLGNMYHYGFCDLQTIQRIYDDLYISSNEDDIEELAFHSLELATMFAENMLKNSYVYVSREDRFAMEVLSMIIKEAIHLHVISYDDLYKDEIYVIHQLCQNETLCALWHHYQSYTKIITSSSPLPGYLHIQAKKRYIDPLVDHQRLSTCSSEIKQHINDFLDLSFDEYLQGLSH